MKRALLIPYSFALMNWAAIAALYYFARGRKHIWNRAPRLIRKHMIEQARTPTTPDYEESA